MSQFVVLYKYLMDTADTITVHKFKLEISINYLHNQLNIFTVFNS